MLHPFLFFLLLLKNLRHLHQISLYGCLLRALRVLRSANVILSEDTRHSGKLLQHYSITSPLVCNSAFYDFGWYLYLYVLPIKKSLIVSLDFQLSYHKFNESQREQLVLKRLRNGEIVALISDAGTPGISDPGTELVSIVLFPWVSDLSYFQW